ncbi:MAG: nitroreductase family protein [Acidimicrobiales bacterium]
MSRAVDAVEVLFARRSTGRLVAPAPARDDLQTILRAAAAAPDHERLRPFRFTVLEGADKDAFGQVLADAYAARCVSAGVEVVGAKQEKDRTKLGRAPLVLVVSAVRRATAIVPWEEQLAAAAAAAQNACLAATALGYGSMWRTGEPSYDPNVKAALGLDAADAIVAWLYLGSYREGVPPEPNDPDLEGLLLPWSPP